MTNPARRVFTTLEVGLRITASLNWKDLQAIRTVDHATLALAACALEKRFEDKCTPFFPQGLYKAFLTMLMECRGGVAGGIPLSAIDEDVPIPFAEEKLSLLLKRYDMPAEVSRDLNLLMPISTFFKGLKWFKDHGFSPSENLPIAPAYTKDVIRFVSLHHPLAAGNNAGGVSVSLDSRICC